MSGVTSVYDVFACVCMCFCVKMYLYCIVLNPVLDYDNHSEVPGSIVSIFQLNSDVHSYNTRHKFPLEETMSSYVTQFLFKLCIFGTRYLDVLALMYLFPNLRRFL